MSAEPSIYLRTNGHRSYERVQRLGIELRWYWTFDDGGVFLKVTPDEYARIKAAKLAGITRCRDQRPESYGVCWS